MSTQPAQAPTMNENSVIKHYKKQLIHRQHDDPCKKDNTHLEELTNTKIYDFIETEEKKNNEVKKTRRKRKNRNCRGQFRHEAMELIKLGTTPSHSLCKTKEPFSARVEKPPEPPSKPAPPKSDPPTVIQTYKPILESPPQKPPQYVHPLPPIVPEPRPQRRNSRELPPRAPVIYRSPPRPYPIPMYPPPTMPYRPTPTLPPYSPPRNVLPPPPPRPRPPHVPSHHVPYSGIHFPFSRYPEYPERKKRKVEEKEKVVAAIDLTVESNKGHKCQCECGKRLAREQEVIISVKDNSVPSTYMRGKMVNGELKFEEKGRNSNMRQQQATKPPPEKPPHLFRIEDLLAKGVRIQAKAQNRPKSIDKLEETIVPIRTEPSRVIVSTKTIEEPLPRPKSKDYTVSNIIGRRQSADIDTISISSSGSESMRSPRPASVEKQIPHGKLFYYKSNNSFIRYFDDTQKKLFINNITSDGHHDKIVEDKEIIELPKNTIFSCKDNLTVEEYVSEMTLVEKFIPRDFFLFYKFVTGYQICNNNLPVSFLTFLKVYNTNGLKVLLDRYVHSLKQN